MFVSPLNDSNTEIISDIKVYNHVNSIKVNGPFLELKGVATFEEIPTFDEHEIRKSLLFVPDIDINNLKEKHFEKYEGMSDNEITEQFIIEIALSNKTIKEIRNSSLDYDIFDENSLAGYYANIDLSRICNKKPLLQGNYNLYIRLEQLASNTDKVKYEKIIPLSSTKDLLERNSLTTKVEYFSASKVLKYNVLISFNHYNKTLNIKNNLLQSYNPKKVNREQSNNDNKYIVALKKRFFRLFYYLFCLLPIKKKKVSFASDSRAELDGNLYFVYEELYKRNIDLDIKFIFNEKIDKRKSYKDLVKIAYHFATSKVILLDDFYPLIYPLRIRNNADLIQIWHAAGAFKTFGFSRIGRPGGPSPHSKNHRNYTKAAVSSDGIRKHYAEGFGIDLEKVSATGIPRSDIFFDEDYKYYVRERLFKKYPFLKMKKVILFAPTFRGNGQASAHYPFEVLNLKKLYENLKDEYIFIFKIHPFVKNELNIPYEYTDFFFDLSDYREVNDLLLITDLLITDYSSICFEFALLNKPMLFFGFDVEQYIQDRDFYYNFFEFIPGPLVRDTDEIIYSIKADNIDYERIKSFVKYFFDNNLGDASKNVVDQLILPSIENNEEQTIDIPNLHPPKSRIELFERNLEEK
ncbi:CDP-glycerol glycerophosphotransferase family protein [Oceanobacillus kimchii]|uniref:CDP-glycerol glycerophosphotransferase family protein n=1 Tax=Oceanobacillus kimchii TaxID=746691 RepID=UPI0021A59E7E|nr:CDP-glycerol glycerophosphotransferase family protein [Oceanobacillus kimchii]MCT1579225.1 CDP-glycerol glycerophosphotransferase family protein [Oceanobacillus kimchii]MCT2134643.1 CDP-glycerol glycerophosphotransferase family protein [Oceanobacillus kimchii]